MPGPYSEGMIVRHPGMPDWGPGMIRAVDGDRVIVHFRDSSEPVRKISTSYVDLEVLEGYLDSLLENLPKWAGKEEELKARHVPIEHGIAWFLDKYPGGFSGPRYLELEREYKIGAHAQFQETLDTENRRELLERDDIEELARRVLSIVGKVNLLSPYEQMAFRDALQDRGAARGYLVALFDLLEPDSLKEPFESLVVAVENLPAEEGGSRVTTWPVLTLLPFLADPERFMFMKPVVTRQCAARIGFELQYSPSLNWITYKKLLQMSEYLLDRLRDHGARDFVDVQSFIWQIGTFEAG